MSYRLFLRTAGIVATGSSILFTTHGNPVSEELPSVPVSYQEIAVYNGPGQSADYAAQVVVSQSGRVYVFGQSTDVAVQNRLFIRCYKADGTLLWSDDRDINGFLAKELVVDSSDNAFAIGTVYNGSGFPPSHDVGIIKYNAEGERVRDSAYHLDFAEPLITPFWSENRPTAAALAPNGSLYITGYVSDEQFGEPSVVSHPVLFAVKTADKMELDWTSSTHLAVDNVPIAQEIPVSLAVDSTGAVYEVSNFGTQGNGTTLRKVTADGEDIWRDSVRIADFGERHHQAVVVGVDSSGTPVVIGTVENEDDSGQEQAFVARFNPADGALLFLKTFSFGETSRIDVAKVLPDGSVIGAATGSFGRDVSVFKMNAEGVLQWEQRYAWDTVQDLKVDAAGSVYVVGSVWPGSQLGVVKFGSAGQFVWAETLPGVQTVEGTQPRPARLAVDANGKVYVARQTNFAMSDPVDGRAYPVFDAVLYRIQDSGVQAPSVRFVSPAEGEVVALGAAFPKIKVEASSPAGVQKVAIYTERHTLLGVMTNAPYELTLSSPADGTQNTLYAVVYDNLGYASYAKVSPSIVSASYTIEFVQPVFQVLEELGAIHIVAKRTRTEGDASVKVTMTPGTAGIADFNYFGSQEPFSVSFNDGESTAEVTLDIEKDTLAEAEESFTLELSEPSEGTLGTLKTATVTIVDDDSGSAKPNGSVEFSSFDYHVTEGGGAVDVTVTRSKSDGPGAVSYYTQPDTATEGKDYLGTLGRIEFAAGEASKTLRMYPLRDSVAEANEAFYVTLHDPENGTALGVRWYTLVHIENETATNNPGPTGISAWAQGAFTTAELADAQISGQFADPDKDGYPNAVEYALGLDPKSADRGNILKPEATEVNGQPALQVTFTRPKGRNDLDYIFESFDKIGSQPCAVCADLVVTDNGNGTETVRVRLVGNVVTRSAFLLLKIALL